ncbi:MAG: sugar transferase [Nitrospirae bacterium]|nr:sugar transferase [Nitrospirota bacterium]
MKSQLLKRIFDLSISLAGLFLLSPLLLIISLLIKLTSSGPVFYRGVRIGRFGKPFRILKFRTMVENAEKIGGTSTPDDDPRITGVGNTLRRYKLDELPQLINVLKGEMSFVGPRPQVPWAVELYSDEEKLLLSVRPGITDLASIKFRNEAEILKGSKAPDREYLEKIAPEKIRLGLEYVKNRSLVFDIKIIFSTLKALLA